MRALYRVFCKQLAKNQIIKNSLKIHFLQNVQDNPNDVHSIARTPLQSAFGVNRYDITRFQGQGNANFTNKLCRNFYHQNKKISHISHTRTSNQISPATMEK